MNTRRFGRKDRKNNKPDTDDILSDRFDPDYRFEDLVDGYEDELFDNDGKAVVPRIETGRSARMDDTPAGSGADRLAAIARDAIETSASETLGRFLSGAVIGVIDTAVADIVAAVPETPSLDEYATAVRTAITETLDAHVAGQPDNRWIADALEGPLSAQSDQIAARLVEFAEALPATIEPAELEAVRADLSNQMVSVVDRACSELARRVEFEFVDRIAARIDAAADETVRRLASQFAPSSPRPQASLAEFTGAVEVVVSDALDNLAVPATVDDIAGLLSQRPPAGAVPVDTLESVLLRLLGQAPEAASSALVTAGFADLHATLSKLEARLSRIVERVEDDSDTRAVLAALAEQTERSDRSLAAAVGTIERHVTAETSRLADTIPTPPSVDEVSRRVVADMSSIIAGSVVEIVSTVTSHVDRAVAEGTVDSIRGDIADVVASAVEQHLGPDVIGTFETRVKAVLTEAEANRHPRRGRRR